MAATKKTTKKGYAGLSQKALEGSWTNGLYDLYASKEEQDFILEVEELEEDILGFYDIYPEFENEEPGYHTQQYAYHQVRSQQGYDTEW